MKMPLVTAISLFKSCTITLLKVNAVGVCEQNLN